jgi:hypothetical protein
MVAYMRLAALAVPCAPQEVQQRAAEAAAAAVVAASSSAEQLAAAHEQQLAQAREGVEAVEAAARAREAALLAEVGRSGAEAVRLCSGVRRRAWAGGAC